MSTSARGDSYYVRRVAEAARSEARGDYVLCVSPALRGKLRLGKFAVASRFHPHGHRSFTADRTMLPLRVRCRVVERPDLPETEVAIDQSVRIALGIPSQYEHASTLISVAPVRVPLRLRLGEAVARACGVNFIFLRVARPHPGDLDQTAIGRVAPDSLDLLGTAFGNKLVLEGLAPDVEDEGRWLVHRVTVYAYELTAVMLADRAESYAREEREEPHKAERERRFADPVKALGVAPDIRPIFLSRPQRQALEAPSLHPVQARREIPSVFAQEFREFGVIFFISILALQQVLPVGETWGNVLLLAPIALGIALLLALTNIRAKANR